MPLEYASTFDGGTKQKPPSTHRPHFHFRSMEEFVGSNSTSADHYSQAQQVADRILRAFRDPLRLIHRSVADFFVLGSTGNVYKVTLAASPACTCPDRAVPSCKHILFVLLRVLGGSLDDACLWSPRMLRPRQLARLLSAPSAGDVLAGPRARERFHQLFNGDVGEHQPAVTVRDDVEGGICPVCLDEMDREAGLVRCGTCGNALHEECWARWKRSRGRRRVICVMCRAQWRRREQEPYVNLAAYASEDDGTVMVEETGASCTGR